MSLALSGFKGVACFNAPNAYGVLSPFGSVGSHTSMRKGKKISPGVVDFGICRSRQLKKFLELAVNVHTTPLTFRHSFGLLVVVRLIERSRTLTLLSSHHSVTSGRHPSSPGVQAYWQHSTAALTSSAHNTESEIHCNHGYASSTEQLVCPTRAQKPVTFELRCKGSERVSPLPVFVTPRALISVSFRHNC